MSRAELAARAAHAERTWASQVRSERAPHDLRDRVLARVAAGSAGGAGSTSTSASAGAAAAAAQTSVHARLTALGFVCALGLSGGFLAQSMSTGVHPTPTAHTMPVSRQLPTEVSAHVARARALGPRAAEPATIATPTTPQSAAPRDQLTNEAGQGAPPSGLAEELRILDDARTALAHGDLAGADGAIARHRRGFAHPVLGEEHQALTIELAWRRGDHAGAQRQLEVLRRQSPHSPQLARLERLMGISAQPAASPK